MEDLFGPSLGGGGGASSVAPRPSLETVVAVFDFEAQADGDLGFKSGDKIEILEKDGQWWTGRKNGKEGVFPFNYVEPENKPDNADPLAQSIAQIGEASLLQKLRNHFELLNNNRIF